MIRFSVGGLVLIVTLLAAGTGPAVAQTGAAEGWDALERMLRHGARLPNRAVRLRLAEPDRARALFLEELIAPPDWPGRTAAWRALGLLRTWLVDQDPCSGCLLLREPAGRHEGTGWYLIGPPSDVGPALQLPHAFRDLDTGRVGLALVREHPFVAAAWNSVPRDTPLAEAAGTADLAHLEQTLFTSFTEALALSGRVTRLIQLHGFARGKRRTPQGHSSHLILSDGTRVPGATVREAAACLRETVEPATRLYPVEVRELGGRTNVQGRIVRALGLPFLHVELSRELRRRLLEDAELRSRLYRCLGG